MSTFLFVWNPSKFSWKKPNDLNADLEEDISTLNQGKKLERRWSCGVIRNAISVDDRVFLMMLGKNINGSPLRSKGIVGAGFVTIPPYLDKHYDKPDKTMTYINIGFEHLLNHETQKILELEELEKINAVRNFWTPQAAKSITTEADKLERRWRDFLPGNSR